MGQWDIAVCLSKIVSLREEYVRLNVCNVLVMVGECSS